MARVRNEARIDAILRMRRDEGRTYQFIADQYGISRQAVYSYVARYAPELLGQRGRRQA